MAGIKVTTIDQYQGLSTDTKPAAPKPGSTFHELDTGMEYIFHDSQWYQDLRGVYNVVQGAIGMPTDS